MSKRSERRKQIQEFSHQEATKELSDLQRKVFDLRLQAMRGEVKDTSVFSKTRKEIAHVLFHLAQLEKKI